MNFIICKIIFVIIIRSFTLSVSEDPCTSAILVENYNRDPSFKISVDVFYESDHLLNSMSWYSFGINYRIPEKCIEEFSCSTRVAVWLDGSHPTDLNPVTRYVCGKYYLNSCCGWRRTIRIQKCIDKDDGLDFYVYQIYPVVQGVRYCAETFRLNFATTISPLDNCGTSKLIRTNSFIPSDEWITFGEEFIISYYSPTSDIDCWRTIYNFSSIVDSKERNSISVWTNENNCCQRLANVTIKKCYDRKKIVYMFQTPYNTSVCRQKIETNTTSLTDSKTYEIDQRLIGFTLFAIFTVILFLSIIFLAYKIKRRKKSPSNEIPITDYIQDNKVNVIKKSNRSAFRRFKSQVSVYVRRYVTEPASNNRQPNVENSEYMNETVAHNQHEYRNATISVPYVDVECIYRNI